jgi:hypothetical protein
MLEVKTFEDNLDFSPSGNEIDAREVALAYHQ